MINQDGDNRGFWYVQIVHNPLILILVEIGMTYEYFKILKNIEL